MMMSDRHDPADRSGSLERTGRILGRALLRRCPNCGGGQIFRNYLQQKPACPDCGMLLDRGERDFFIGAYTINLILAELVVVFGGLLVALWTWPEVPWTVLMWGLVVLMIAGPVVLYPFSRQLWLGFDLVFQPAQPSDFSTPRASGAVSPIVDNLGSMNSDDASGAST
jgi:uncharacterized protein (DUF983 family)